jgi:ribonuclease Y
LITETARAGRRPGRAGRGHGNGTRHRGGRPGGRHRRGRGHVPQTPGLGGWRPGRRPAAPEGLRDREAELARSRERTQSFERSLDRRAAELDRREQEFAAERSALEGERSTLERLRDEHTHALERISGLSAGQARTALLKDVEDEARHEATRRVRRIEEEAKRDAERRVRSILSVAMQRLAAGPRRRDDRSRSSTSRRTT